MRTKYGLLIILCLNTASVAAQTYPTGRRTLTFADPARGNRSVLTELYYPAATAGTNASLPPGSTAFSLVVFGHGFLIPASSYSWLGDSLSRRGYIVAFPTTEGSISPDHAAFGADIRFLCSYLPTLNDSSNSFLQGRIRNRVAAGGHSMGGGASFLAATANPQLQALFNFAAAETNPSAKTAAAAVQVPALVFAGSRDCVVPDSNQNRLYQQIPYPCKTYVNITDALHCHFANNNSTCTSGQFFSGCNNSPISAAAVFEKTLQLLFPFLDYYLNDSCGSNAILDNRLASLGGITVQRTCSSDPFTCFHTEYIFTGNGLWSNPLNWQYEQIPPSLLPAGSRIRIRPAAGGSCLLDATQDISPGAALLIEAGKAIIIPGQLIVR